jgi:RimJ/RimL family protein N-acetyltransferase
VTVGSQNQVSGVPLSGRWVRLEPVQPQHAEFLFRLATDEDTGFRWRLRGAVPSREQYERALWQSILTQFVVTSVQGNAPVGQVIAYNPNSNSGHASVGIVISHEARKTGCGIEAMHLFVSHLFATYSFRKLYFETPEFNLSQFGSALGLVLREEGHLIQNDYYGGRYWDSYIHSIWREEWMELTQSMHELFAGVSDGADQHA